MENWNVPGYAHIKDVGEMAFEDIEDFRSGNKRPLQTSLKKLRDKIGGMMFGEQWSIVMPSGTGKTAFATWMGEEYINPILNPAYAGKIGLLVDSYEMPAKKVFTRSLASKSNLTTQQILSYYERLQDEQLEFLKTIKAKLGTLPIFYRQTPMHVSEWRENKKKIFALNPDKYFVGIFDHTRLIGKKNEKSELELLTNLVTEGLYLTNEFDYLQIFLSQVNGNIETSVDRNELGKHLLQKTDIFGNSALFQTCDGVITGQRPGMYGLSKWGPKGKEIDTGLTSMSKGDDDLMILNILKNREGNIGPIAIRHNIKNYQFFDERKGERNVSSKTKIDLTALNDLDDD